MTGLKSKGHPSDDVPRGKIKVLWYKDSYKLVCGVSESRIKLDAVQAEMSGCISDVLATTILKWTGMGHLRGARDVLLKTRKTERK